MALDECGEQQRLTPEERFRRRRARAEDLDGLAASKTLRDPDEHRRQSVKAALLMQEWDIMPSLESLILTAADPVSADILRFGFDLTQISEAQPSDEFMQRMIESLHERMQKFEISLERSNYLTKHIPEVFLMMNGRADEKQRVRATGEKAGCHALSVLHYYVSLGEYLLKNPAWASIVKSDMFWELAIAALDHDLVEDGSGATIIRTKSLEEETPYQLIWRSDPLGFEDLNWEPAQQLLKAYGELTVSIRDEKATLFFTPTQRKGKNPILFADIVPDRVQAALQEIFSGLVLVPSHKDERGRVVFKVQKSKLSSAFLTHDSMAGILALTNFDWQRKEGEAKVRERWGADWINGLGSGVKTAVLGALGKMTAQSDTIHDVVRLMNPENDEKLVGVVLVHFIKLMDIFHNLKTLPGMIKRKGQEGARQYLLEEIAKARALEHQLMYEIRRVCQDAPERYMLYMDAGLMQMVSKFGILIECHDGLDWYVQALQKKKAESRRPGRREQSPQPESIEDIIAIVNEATALLAAAPPLGRVA